MEFDTIWLNKLVEILRKHIYDGLSKTLSDVKSLCRGHGLSSSIQVTMERIPHLSTNTLKTDYSVLIKSLNEMGKTEDDMNEIIKKTYHTTTLMAMRNSNIDCSNFKPSYINGAIGMDFIHQVYINVGRTIWYDPDILISGKGITTAIDGGIRTSILNGIDLDKLIKEIKSESISVGIDKATLGSATTTRDKIEDRTTSILDTDSDDDLPPAPNLDNDTVVDIEYDLLTMATMNDNELDIEIEGNIDSEPKYIVELTTPDDELSERVSLLVSDPVCVGGSYKLQTSTDNSRSNTETSTKTRVRSNRRSHKIKHRQ